MAKPGYICFRYFFFCLVWIQFAFPAQSIPQEIRISYDDYTKAIGWENDHIVMKNILKDGLIHRVSEQPASYYENSASFFSMVLLLSGVRPQHYYTLEQNGIDVIHAITADVRPFSEQSLLSDLVITGRVVEVVPQSLEEDGFDITLKIEIIENLKGAAPKDTILIRQRNSARLPDSDTRPEQGESYLFLLSSGMYGYHKANHQFRENNEAVVMPPQIGRELLFIIYRMYPYVNEQLQRSPENIKAVFSSLRFVDDLLKQQ